MNPLAYETEAPCCPECGQLIEVQTFEPEQPWYGTCTDNHTHLFQEVQDDE